MIYQSLKMTVILIRSDNLNIYFTVPGEPQGKGRPRFVRKGSSVSTYTPPKTVSYENRVKLAYSAQCKNYKFVDKEPLKMTIKAFFKPPVSTSKKNLDLMIDKKIRPVKKPDFDNIGKIIADSLNGIAYADDSCIVEATISKFYDIYPRTEITIENLYTDSDM